MYDQSKVSELICGLHESRCGFHRHRRLPRRRRRWTRLFLRHCGTRRTGLQLRAGRSCALQERSGRPHADACARSRAERTSKPSRRTSWRCRRPRNRRISCGCTCSTTILRHHRADPGQGRDGGSLQSSCLRAAEAWWVLRHRRSCRRRPGRWALATPSRCIGLSLAFARKEVERGGVPYWTRKAPCSRRRTIRTSIQGVRSLDQGGENRSLRLSVREAPESSQHRLQVDS